MISAYITVQRPLWPHERVGRTGLANVLTEQAPGIRNTAQIATHVGGPVLRIRQHLAEQFRHDLWFTLRALQACGYRWTVELTAGADRALDRETAIRALALSRGR